MSVETDSTIFSCKKKKTYIFTCSSPPFPATQEEQGTHGYTGGEQTSNTKQNTDAIRQLF